MAVARIARRRGKPGVVAGDILSVIMWWLIKIR
jgi:hypothetical protein